MQIKFELAEKQAERVSEITMTNYKGDLSDADLHNLINDLICEVDRLQEKLEDTEDMINQKIEDRYVMAELQREWERDRIQGI